MIDHEHILGILPGHVRLRLQHLAKCLIKIINLFLAKLFLNQDLLLSHLHLHRINFLLRDFDIIIVGGAGFVLTLLGILLVEEFVLDLLVVGFLLSLLLSALLIFVLFKIIVEVCKLLKQVVVSAHVVVRHEVLGA